MVAGRLPEPLCDLVLADAEGARFLTAWGAGVARARRLQQAGVRRLLDVACGIGGQALAARALGLEVIALEADPLRAQLARHNLQRCIPAAPEATVVVGDGTDSEVLRPLLQGVDAVLLDPSRAPSASQRQWADLHPDPLAVAAALRSATPSPPPLVVELPPFLAPTRVPLGAGELEYLGLGNRLNRLTFYPPPFAQSSRSVGLIDDAGATLGRLLMPQEASTTPGIATAQVGDLIGQVHPALAHSGLLSAALAPGGPLQGAPLDTLEGAEATAPGQERHTFVRLQRRGAAPWCIHEVQLASPLVPPRSDESEQALVGRIALGAAVDGLGPLEVRLQLEPMRIDSLHRALGAALQPGRPGTLLQLGGQWWLGRRLR